MTLRGSIRSGRVLSAAVAPIWLSLALVACEGTIGGGEIGDGSIDGEDGGTPLNGCTETQASLQRRVGAWIETTCSHAGCHGPVGTLRPMLSAASLPALADNGDFEPDGRIMRRLDPEDPARIMPPTRHENPAEVITMIEDWVREGTRTDCIELPPQPEAAPNSLDQDTLFTCVAPEPWAPSHSLLSRDEFVHRAGGYLWNTQLRATPLAPGQPYSTQNQSSSVNDTTLALHVDALALTHDYRRGNRGENLRVSGNDGETAANRIWMRGLTPAQRTELECMTDDRRPASEIVGDAACKSLYLTLLLERHAFQRRPSETEVAVLLPFLDEELESESERVHRLRTRARVVEAAMMMFGSLHRSTIGDDAGALTPDEWSGALASALSTASWNNAYVVEAIPRPEFGWLADYWRERDAGTFETQDEAVRFMSEVLDPAAGYVGGEVDAGATTARPDLYYDYRAGELLGLSRPRRRRGRHWLAPRIATFFREFFDYADVASVAKDDPGATSRWSDEDVGFARGAVNGGYGFTQTGTSPNRPPHSEPPMLDQLDDFIARTVMRSEDSGDDVLAALLTSRTYRVPAAVAGNFETYRSFPTTDCELVDCEGATCCAEGERCMTTSFSDDGTPQAQCMRLSFREFHYVGAVYNVPIIEEAAELYSAEDSVVTSSPEHDARWVEMPGAERAGVLTHPTWLAAHGGNTEASASAVLRGHWIREHLFCEDVGGLDLVNLEAQLEVPGDNDRARDLLIRTFGDLSVPTSERTSGDARCANAACHGRMNNLGMAFEVFNHAGFVRTNDHGRAPDGSARIAFWPGQSGRVAVADAVELSQLLSEDLYVRRCFLRHVFRYFAGRFETPADACVLSAMESAFSEGSFFGALEALLTHESYLVRHTGEGR